MTQGWSVDLLVTIFVKYVTIFLFYLECHLYKGRESPKDIIQFGMFYIAIFFLFDLKFHVPYRSSLRYNSVVHDTSHEPKSKHLSIHA